MEWTKTVCVHFGFHLFKNDLIILRVFWFGEEEKITLKKLHFSIWRFDLVPSPPFQFHVDGRFHSMFVLSWEAFLLCREKNVVFLVIHKIHTYAHARARAQRIFQIGMTFGGWFNSVWPNQKNEQQKNSCSSSSYSFVVVRVAYLIALNLVLLFVLNNKNYRKLRDSKKRIFRICFFSFHFISFTDTWKFNATRRERNGAEGKITQQNNNNNSNYTISVT